VDASRPFLVFRDEATPETEALLDDLRDGSFAVVPAHWATEVMNGLLVAQRPGRASTQERVARFWCGPLRLADSDRAGPAPNPWNGVIDLAMEHGLTAYDAAYRNWRSDWNFGWPHPIKRYAGPRCRPAAAVRARPEPNAVYLLR